MLYYFVAVSTNYSITNHPRFNSKLHQSPFFSAHKSVNDNVSSVNSLFTSSVLIIFSHMLVQQQAERLTYSHTHICTQISFIVFRWQFFIVSWQLLQSCLESSVSSDASLHLCFILCSIHLIIQLNNIGKIFN